MPVTLPMKHKKSTPVGNTCFSFIIDHDSKTITYFSNLQPFDSHSITDKKAFLLRAAKFRVEAEVRSRDLVDALGLSRSTILRAANQYKEHGEESFYEPRRARGPSRFTEEMKREANRMFGEGMSGAAVGRELGVGATTVNLNRRAGVIGACNENGGVGESVGVKGRGERDSRDREAAMGRGARNTEGRVLASRGLIEEAKPEFEEKAGAVVNGGVLAALPALLKEGLVDSIRDTFSLRRGYYGANSIVLFLALMLLARVRNPESIRYQSPGEWGAILGLDRCPEVKTLRRKIRGFASSGDALERWQSELAGRWMRDDPQSFATLCVDGHVKTYSGGGGRLPKKFVPREKLCLPASVSYWVNALGGKPFLCIHKDMDPGMVKAVEADVIKELESLGALDGAVDITGEEPGEAVVTLVFDREGWSPQMFRRLAGRGIACITWHKNFKGEDWPEEEFAKVRVPVYGPAGTHSSEVSLAERKVSLGSGFEVRQVRRLVDTGRQIPLITTHPTMTTQEVAGAMFSRWSQENYFKYMREQFNLDSLTTYILEELGADTMVVNPVKREKRKLLGKRRGRLGNLRGRLAGKEKKLAGEKGKKREKREREVEEIKGEIEGIEEEVRVLGDEIKGLPEKIAVGEMGEEQRYQALENKERLFLDIIRMVAYRAETRMMGPVIECQGKKPNARKLLQSLFTSEADILPDRENKILRVRFLGLGSDSCERDLEKLVDELNATNTIFPGTDFRMVYELPDQKRPANSQ